MMKASFDILMGALRWCFSGFWVCVKIGMAAVGASIAAGVITLLPLQLITLGFGENYVTEWIAYFLLMMFTLLWFGLFGYYTKDMIGDSISRDGRKLYAWEKFQAKKEVTRREFLQAGIADSKTKREH